MKIPLEMTYRGVAASPSVDSYVREQVRKLERFCDNMTSCRVAIERPQQRHTLGNPYRVRIEVKIPPGHDLAVAKEPGNNDVHTELRTVVRDAFSAMEKQIKKVVNRRRGDVKVHDIPRAFVVRLFPEDGYGFIKGPDGDEYYFHRNSVLHDDFERLTVGTEVRFEEEMGEKGPQASTVQIVAKRGGVGEGKEERV